MRLDDSINELAAGQHSLIATWQLRALGAGKTEVDRLSNGRRWERRDRPCACSRRCAVERRSAVDGRGARRQSWCGGLRGVRRSDVAGPRVPRRSDPGRPPPRDVTPTVGARPHARGRRPAAAPHQGHAGHPRGQPGATDLRAHRDAAPEARRAQPRVADPRGPARRRRVPAHRPRSRWPRAQGQPDHARARRSPWPGLPPARQRHRDAFRRDPRARWPEADAAPGRRERRGGVDGSSRLPRR